MSNTFKNLRLRQVDEKLEQWRDLRDGDTPRSGWIRTIRQTLGMSSSQLAHRMEISQQAVSDLERREVQGSTTLSALRAAADALDAEVVYAIVPKRPLWEMVQAQAKVRAADLLAKAAHTMSLEAQDLPDCERSKQLSETAEELLQAWPRTLWDPADDIGNNRSTGTQLGDCNGD